HSGFLLHTCSIFSRVLIYLFSSSFFLSVPPLFSFFFFFNDTATTEIYTLSLHDALPISSQRSPSPRLTTDARCTPARRTRRSRRSEEHTSELQSRSDLVCRLLLEKKKNKKKNRIPY